MDKHFIGEKSDLLVNFISSITESDWEYIGDFGQVNKKFYKKYKLGTCGLYAAGAHMAYLSNLSHIFPRWLPFHKSMIHLVHFKNRKRIIVSSAFITLLDEVVDNDIKKNKTQELKEIIFGVSSLTGEREVLRKLGKKLISMGADLSVAISWVEAEEKNLRNENDPEDICFRRFGCEGSADLLTCPVIFFGLFVLLVL